MSIDHWTRRAILQKGALLAAAPIVCRHLLASMPAGDGSAAIVKTPLGTMRGELATGVRVFRGVPFAEPPVGDLRFRAPLPKKPWTGELDATRFGPEPRQERHAKRLQE